MFSIKRPFVFCFVALLSIFQAGCGKEQKTRDFDFFLDEPCMLLNREQDNTREGTYLEVITADTESHTLEINLPEDFYVSGGNRHRWVLGWGTGKPLYDAGIENLRAIDEIDPEKGMLKLGKLLRGNGFPMPGRNVVFWNRHPSGYVNQIKKPIIDPAMWPLFAGQSICFGAIEFDSLLNQWVMLAFECDNLTVRIYAATSNNLSDWKPANDGKPMLTKKDFEDCSWAGHDPTGEFEQTPYVSDAIRHNGKWIIFLDGYDSNGKRNIGTAISETSLLGPYKISEKPAITPGKEGSWNDAACFYAKVAAYQNGFLMFYDGKNKQGRESIGMAVSSDLIEWQNQDFNPVIDKHKGWRSAPETSEPNYIEIRNDSIFLLCAGAKKFKDGWWHHYITHRMYLDKTGNVDDAQLGVFLSTDGGKNFTEHADNPVFVNDYANVYENSHLGGNFKRISSDTAEYIIYQAKSDFESPRYSIFLRKKL